MPRIARLKNTEEPTVYHVISRTCLPDYPFESVENDELLKIIRRFSRIYFVEIFGFCLLGNHHHILLRMYPGINYSDEDVKARYVAHHGDDENFSEQDVQFYRDKYSDLSEFVKDVKITFSRFYNRRHNRKGTLWAERFKSLIVQDGSTLINCLAYIDLNPVRAGIVERPEEYRWCSLAYHLQTGNRDGFLSMDFGLREFGVLEPAERLRRYRRHVYEAGGVKRSDGKSAVTIDEKIVEKERKADFKISRIHRFRYRTRWFTDSGIIGSKEFVSKNYQRFKSHFNSKREKKPKRIKGLEGVYSLKRLAEV